MDGKDLGNNIPKSPLTPDEIIELREQLFQQNGQAAEAEAPPPNDTEKVEMVEAIEEPSPAQERYQKITIWLREDLANGILAHYQAQFDPSHPLHGKSVVKNPYKGYFVGEVFARTIEKASRQRLDLKALKAPVKRAAYQKLWIGLGIGAIVAAIVAAVVYWAWRERE